MTPGPPASAGGHVLTILYTNDLHGRQGALDYLEQLDRGPDHLLLDAGDALQGSNTLFRRREPILARMRSLGYRVQAMGNREFHYLRRVHRWRAAERGFPVLAANLIDLWGGRPAPWWQPAWEGEIGGLRVGVFGATPVQFPEGAVWERLFGFRFLDPSECLPSLSGELAGRNDLVIFLSHLGVEQDRALAPSLPGVDLILGGHSHTVMARPERVGGCLLVQAGSHSRYLGEIRVRPGSPPSLDYRLIPLEQGGCGLALAEGGAG